MLQKTSKLDIPSELFGSGKVSKRIFDFALALVSLVLLLPIFLIVYMAIKLTSGGAGLSRELRHGYRNETIWIFKFRTGGSARLGVESSDATETVIGQMLIRTGLAHVPKLLNVLLGEMSIVGPTLHLPEQDALFEALNLRGEIIRPGLIGWAQLNGHEGETSSPEETRLCIEYDLYYLDNRSLALDLKIILKSIFKSALYD
jgi:lipopolysaccharide/colanic/teichoic acid biosynthesis glycosyltransferase